MSDQDSDSPESNKRFRSEDENSVKSGPEKKKQRKEEPSLASNSVAERMMTKMGFTKGKGLGRQLQGIVEPVAASTQKGRRGFGLQLKELEKAHNEFDSNKEIVEIKEKILWLHNPYENSPSVDEVEIWNNERAVGKRKETIDGETLFCDEDIVQSVIASKSVFDRLDKNEMREARTRSNPFETIRGSIFLNRAAVKMANMDKACDFMFTQPNIPQNELLYFADVCAGPGGFSEYVLWRKKWRAKGFGFTLKSENDFKLHDFHAGPCESFHPYYGPKEDGNVYDPENQRAFQDLIMKETENQGVHFMMADGGFSVEGQENIQEILSKQLYLCQCLVALMIVRTGGHFVTKVFDLYTPFSAGLIYIMYRCFDRISVFKPNTSRPANSERYLICQGKRPDIQHLVDYLYDTNIKLLKNDKSKDILELIPVDKLISDKEFSDYLKNSNEELGERQILGLKKIAAYAENKDLLETRQPSVREECLKHWGLPNGPRILPRRMDASAKAQALLQNSFSVIEKISPKDVTKLNKQSVCSTILANDKPAYDWFYIPCSSGEDFLSSGPTEDRTATFYLSMGRSVHRYCNGRWEAIQSIAMPRDTLVYAEMVAEWRKESKSQAKTFGLHILDAFTLGSENISDRYLTERMEIIQLFCKALWKPMDTQCSRVRAKPLISVTSNIIEEMKLQEKVMKNGSKVLAYTPPQILHENDNNEPYYYVLRSIVFFKATEEPWARHSSSKFQKYYFYNKKDTQSCWEIPDSARANFSKTLQSRVLWNWPSDKSFSMEEFVHCMRQKYSGSAK